MCVYVCRCVSMCVGAGACACVGVHVSFCSLRKRKNIILKACFAVKERCTSKIINLFFSGYSHILFAMNNKVSNWIYFVIFFTNQFYELIFCKVYWLQCLFAFICTFCDKARFFLSKNPQTDTNLILLLP